MKKKKEYSAVFITQIQNVQITDFFGKTSIKPLHWVSRPAALVGVLLAPRCTSGCTTGHDRSCYWLHS